jgi:hypothetical protein
VFDSVMLFITIISQPVVSLKTICINEFHAWLFL